jgi:hypothetical protein
MDQLKNHEGKSVDDVIKDITEVSDTQYDYRICFFRALGSCRYYFGLLESNKHIMVKTDENIKYIQKIHPFYDAVINELDKRGIDWKTLVPDSIKDLVI